MNKELEESLGVAVGFSGHMESLSGREEPWVGPANHGRPLYQPIYSCSQTLQTLDGLKPPAFRLTR